MNYTDIFSIPRNKKGLGINNSFLEWVSSLLSIFSIIRIFIPRIPRDSKKYYISWNGNTLILVNK